MSWRGRRTWSWWMVAAAALVFLPNAPYALTDLVHVPETLRTAPSLTSIVVVIIPLFVALLGAGVLSYVVCLRLLRAELRRRGWTRSGRLAAAGAVHVLCALGIVLGRIERLNSWDVIRPHILAGGLDSLRHHPAAVAATLVAVMATSLVADRMAFPLGRRAVGIGRRLRAH